MKPIDQNFLIAILWTSWTRELLLVVLSCAMWLCGGIRGLYLLHASDTAALSHDNQKCLQTLLKIPSEVDYNPPQLLLEPHLWICEKEKVNVSRNIRYLRQ